MASNITAFFAALGTIETVDFIIPLDFDPLAAPAILELIPPPAPNNQKYRVVAQKIRGVTGTVEYHYPRLAIPKQVISPVSTLNSLALDIYVLITDVQQNNLHVKLYQSDAVLQLGGVQRQLTAAFASGLIPASTAVNLPHLYQESEADSYLLSNIPRWTCKLGKDALVKIEKAAINNYTNPYKLQDFPIGEHDPTDEEIQKFTMVYNEYRRKRHRAVTMEPTTVASDIWLTTPFHEHQHAPDIAPPIDSRDAKRRRLNERCDAIAQGLAQAPA